MAQGIRVFLSYKREDYSIAQTLRQQIPTVTDRCDFFVDIETIDAFDNWEERIESQLKLCDYFILLYTGQDKNYEYCMAEAGSFAVYHQEPEPTETLANALAEHLSYGQGPRLCCLHDTYEGISRLLQQIPKLSYCRILRSILRWHLPDNRRSIL